MTRATLQVIGVGGGGSNAVDRMLQVGLNGIRYVVANTDGQALARSDVGDKILLGAEMMHGRGAGGDPALGARAAEASRREILATLEGTAMVFLAIGMGGGTGTGAAPVIAEMARAQGILTVAIATLPFAFEGKRRRVNAEAGLRLLRQQVDTLVVVPNDALLSFVDTRVSLDIAFRVADDILRQGMEGISSLMTTPGLINLDLASVQSTLRAAGGALLAIGYGEGEERAKLAARSALDSPLLDMSAIVQATNVLVNITGGPDLTLHDVRNAMELINDAVSRDASISMGAVVDPTMKGRVQITLIAGGLEDQQVIRIPAAIARPLEAPAANASEPAPALPAISIKRRVVIVNGKPRPPVPAGFGGRKARPVPATSSAEPTRAPLLNPAPRPGRVRLADLALDLPDIQRKVRRVA